jgi:hypothetical protein
MFALIHEAAPEIKYMKLNLTEDKPVELPENENGIPILVGCTAIGFIVNFLLSGNPYYAMGAAVGSIIFPGIVTLIGLFFTKKWSIVFPVAWIILFLMSIAGQFVKK